MSMAIKDWLPLIVAIVGLVGGAIIYQIQKATDRKNQILLERRDLYRKLVVSVREIMPALFDVNNRDEMVVRHIGFTSLVGELLVCAPDQVVKGCENLEHSVREAVVAGLSKDEKKLRESAKTVEKALETAIFQMRRDTFGDSQIGMILIERLVSDFGISIGLRLP